MNTVIKKSFKYQSIFIFYALNPTPLPEAFLSYRVNTYSDSVALKSLISQFPYYMGGWAGPYNLAHQSINQSIS